MNGILYVIMDAFSDVLGGLAAGVAWLGFSIWIFNLLLLSRAKRVVFARDGTASGS